MVDDAPTPPEQNSFDLSDFSQVSDDAGVSLEALSSAYAELISGGSVPYEAQDEAAGPSQDEADQAVEPPDEPSDSDRHCEVTPASILEAVLFVGHPESRPLTGEEVAALMRGVRPQEIDGLIDELNEQYEREGCPYRVVSRGAGYLMELNAEYARLRNKFYGRVREVRLSQAAIDILAIVAYRQPLTRDEIDRMRGAPSGGVLSQLVRRQLLRIERLEGKPRKVQYHTTTRFLRLFGLDNLAELPQANEVDRRF